MAFKLLTKANISMTPNAIALRALPVDAFESSSSLRSWLATPFTALSDAQLIETCIDAISPPKVDKRNSFLLHAPLELLARAALLPSVRPEAREIARQRIAEIAVRYAMDGEEVVVVTASRLTNSDEARKQVIEAIGAGNRELANAALSFLLQHESPAGIAHFLFDLVATSYAAAGHAPILFAELHRASGRYASVGNLIRAPLRYLVGQQNATLEWAADFRVRESVDIARESESLWRAVEDHSITSELSAPQALGRYARDLSAFSFGDVKSVERVLLRLAAHSMLQDEPKHAPYGWTHCLTMPLALMANAQFSSRPERAAAMAAAEVYAFRATMGIVEIDEHWKPEPPLHRDLLAATPTQAASIAFHTSIEKRGELRCELATFAATHRDAHLAKYTLACFDASARDPDAVALYLAAAAYLGAWWRDLDARR
jgi:hypothetical protein